MVANLRADNIDGFLAPDNICQRAIYDGVVSCTSCPRDLGRSSLLQLRGQPRVHHGIAQQFCRFDTGDRRCHRLRLGSENRKQIAEPSSPANYLNAPVTVLEQV